MPIDSIFLTIVFSLMAVILISGIISADLTALLGLGILACTGHLSPEETFSGFSSPAVTTMLGMFCLSGALRETGVSHVMGEFMSRVAKKSEAKSVALLMTLAAAVSAFVNNVAVVALFLPAALHMARVSGVRINKLLMPLAISACLGGMITLIGTTPNMVLAGVMHSHGITPFRLFDFAPYGIAATVAGIGYCVFIGIRQIGNSSGARGKGETLLSELYKLSERIVRFQVPSGSSLIGRPLMEAQLVDRYGARILGIIRGQHKILMPHARDVLELGDELIVAGRQEDLKEVGTDLKQLPVNGSIDLETASIGVVEVVLSPRSALIGKSVREVKFRDHYGFQILAIWRQGKPIRARVMEEKFQFGDALLLQGPRSKMSILVGDEDFVMVSDGVTGASRPQKAWFAIAGFLLMIALSATHILPIEVVTLLAALFVILSGALKIEEAYRSIDWRSVTVVAALLPMGIVAERAGFVSWVAQEFVQLAGDMRPLAVLVLIGILSSALSQILDGSIAVVIVAPIAIKLAALLGIEPHSLLMMTALGASITFMSPVSHKVNLLVMGPGGYKPIDFFKVGTPLSLLVLLVLAATIPLILTFK